MRVHSALIVSVKGSRISKTQAAIYDKTLKRKDSSGLVAKDANATKDDDKKDDVGKDKQKKAAEEPKKSNADSGKIVNLMSGMSTPQIPYPMLIAYRRLQSSVHDDGCWVIHLR